MNLGLVAGAALLAVAVAVRSTWSPCGLSMLSTVTPLAERGRGHRFAATAAWFIVGAIAGGATLGAGAALLAFGMAAVDLSSDVTVALAALAATVAFAADLRLFGFRLPMHTRQVDEVWLGKYRPWVYGVGFGWQIGVGLATYIMTAGVYLLIVLAALSASPTAAFLLAARVRDGARARGAPRRAHHRPERAVRVPSDGSSASVRTPAPSSSSSKAGSRSSASPPARTSRSRSCSPVRSRPRPSRDRARRSRAATTSSDHLTTAALRTEWNVF